MQNPYNVSTPNKNAGSQDPSPSSPSGVAFIATVHGNANYQVRIHTSKRRVVFAEFEVMLEPRTGDLPVVSPPPEKELASIMDKLP